MEAAQKHGMKVRGYVSTVIACPYDGKVAPAKVAEVSERLFRMGCYEVSLGDTIGVGTPGECVAMIDAVAEKVPREKLAAHFHDTYGQSLANIMAVMERGIAVFDTAVAGLGGCPYAKGASGNVGTEDVIYLMNGLGIAHGVDLDAIAAAGRDDLRRARPRARLEGGAGAEGEGGVTARCLPSSRPEPREARRSGETCSRQSQTATSVGARGLAAPRLSERGGSGPEEHERALHERSRRQARVAPYRRDGRFAWIPAGRRRACRQSRSGDAEPCGGGRGVRRAAGGWAISPASSSAWSA